VHAGVVVVVVVAVVVVVVVVAVYLCTVARLNRCRRHLEALPSHVTDDVTDHVTAEPGTAVTSLGSSSAARSKEVEVRDKRHKLVLKLSISHPDPTEPSHSSVYWTVTVSCSSQSSSSSSSSTCCRCLSSSSSCCCCCCCRCCCCSVTSSSSSDCAVRKWKTAMAEVCCSRCSEVRREIVRLAAAVMRSRGTGHVTSCK